MLGECGNCSFTAVVCNSASACIGLLAVVILSGLDGDNPLPCGRYEPAGRAGGTQSVLAAELDRSGVVAAVARWQ